MSDNTNRPGAVNTTPLPPLPPVEKEWCEDSHMYVQPTIPKYGSYEMRAYATQARADLEAENKRLREDIAALRKEALEPPTNKTHRCVKCLHAYRPNNGESEDCPACGHDGGALEKQP